MSVAESLSKERSRLARRPPDIVSDIRGQAVFSGTPTAPAKITAVSLQNVTLGMMVWFVSLASRMANRLLANSFPPAGLPLSLHGLILPSAF